MKRLSLLACLVVLLVTAWGCVTARIGRILDNPYRYQGRVVRVEGTVVNSASAVVAGFYQVEDGSGRITVITNGPGPRRGTHVRVSGRVASGVSVLGQSYGTTIRERDRHVFYGLGN